MLKKYLLIILLIPFALSAQDKRKTLLVVPLLKKNINIRGNAWRCQLYNKVSDDSIATYIQETTMDQLKTIFNDYSLKFINEFATASALDSSYSLKQRNRFYYNPKDSSFHLHTEINKNTESYHNNYYGCELNEKGISLIKKVIADSKCDYVLFLNQFEVIPPNSTFSMSCEIVDKNMKKVYGDKNEWFSDVSKTMYYDVMKYFLKESEEDALKKVKEYLKP